MEFRDLKKQYQELKNQIDDGILHVVESGAYVQGPAVKELEQELSQYVGSKRCITCANGTDALTMALMAWDIKEGDGVFVPDFTFFSSGEVVAHTGATPIFVDVEKDTFNICPDMLEQAIVKVKEEGKFKPKVVIAVDLFGLPADYPKLRTIADKHGLMVLEDGAQGFGGRLNGKRACSFGDISTTSFFPAKPLGCYGDGGAIFTDDDQLAEVLVSIGAHGKGHMKYENVRIGLNSRLDTIQAAVLLVKLNAFKEYELTRVNHLAQAYTTELKNVVQIPEIPIGFYSSWAQYTIRVTDKTTRDALQFFLKQNDVPSMVYYPKPMHKQQAFRGQTFYDADYLNTTFLCDTVLSLPIHPYLEDEEIQRVAFLIKQFLKSKV